MPQSSNSLVAQIFLLGLPTWCLLDGTWAFLSALVPYLPESYQISSYLMVFLTMGNLVAIFIGSNFLPAFSKQSISRLILVILFVGAACGVLLSLFWSCSVELYGRSYSIPFYILFFIAGICACLSNITHYAFVSYFDAKYTTYLATGFGVGSMIAGMIALIQGLDPSSHFLTPTMLYILISTLYIPAIASILSLTPVNTRATNEEYKTGKDNVSTPSLPSPDDSAQNDSTRSKILMNKNYQQGEVNTILEDCINDPQMKLLPTSSHAKSDLIQNKIYSSSLHETEMSNTGQIKVKDYYFESTSFISLEDQRVLYTYHWMFVLQGLNAFLSYGLIPAIISSVCGKFDNRNTSLLFATSLTSIFDPFFRFLTDFIRIQSMNGFFISTTIMTSISIVLFTFLWFPNDVNLYRGDGGLIASVLYVLLNVINVFSNTSLFRCFKDCPHIGLNYNLSQFFADSSSISTQSFISADTDAIKSREIDSERDDIIVKYRSKDLDEEEDKLVMDAGAMNASDEHSKTVHRRYRLGGVVTQTGAMMGTALSLLLLVSGALSER